MFNVFAHNVIVGQSMIICISPIFKIQCAIRKISPLSGFHIFKGMRSPKQNKWFVLAKLCNQKRRAKTSRQGGGGCQTDRCKHRPPQFFFYTPVASSTGHHDNLSWLDWKCFLQLAERVGGSCLHRRGGNGKHSAFVQTNV